MNNEIRKEYVLDKYSIIARSSNLTYKNFIQLRRLVSDPAGCPFCSHNASKLPSIIDEIQNLQKQWLVRVVSNLVETVSPQGNPILSTDNRYFTWASAYGKEEVIIESPNHYDDFGDLPPEMIEINIKKYMQRINELEKSPYIAYVALFKNQGFNAGSNTTHSHSQLMAFSVIPKTILDEEESIQKFKKIYNVCPHCDLQNVEKNSFRRVYQNNTFTAFTPYSSDYPFEVRIYPRRHVGKLTLLSDGEISDLALTFKYVLSKLNSLNYPPYNIVYVTAPVDASSDFHFYIRVLPRLSQYAGFELITCTKVNTISPEDAAKFYRGEL